jgi:alpha-L-rhamnosidase
MGRLFLIFFFGIILISCKNSIPDDKDADTWADAKWIAYERLPDSLKLVPAVHGNGNNLGNRGLKRSYVPMFRKEFKVDGNIEHVSINISGLGHYEFYINGKKIGDRFLSPGWSYYQKRIFYNNYDITDQIRNGENVIGVIVGNGFYNINRERYRKLVIAYGYPKLIFNIIVKYKDGKVLNFVSDESCRVSPSPITFSSIYGGEDYDATLEQENWRTSGFDDSDWKRAVLVNESTVTFEIEKDDPLKVMQEFKVRKISRSKTGRVIYDFGQNTSGIISLKVKGNKGTQIRILPDELINSEGNVTQTSGGKPYEFNYTLKGIDIEEWQPRFTYYGFRYADVEIIEPERAEKKTEIIELKLLHTRNSSPVVGSFSCSDSLFNRIFELINWGIKSNMASVATDCPHREKLGWLEQTYLIGPSMHYNYDIRKLFNKIVLDMIDSQLDNGLVPDIAPEYVHFTDGFRDSPEWGSASVIIPWQLFHWYGDKDVLIKAYPMMKRYVDYLGSKAQANILDYGLGDWYDLGPKHPGVAQLTPKAVTATSIFYYDLQIVSKVAGILGHNADMEKYGGISGEVRAAFLKKFYNHETGVCSTGSQTAYAMPLYTGIILEKDRGKVFNNLIDSIKKYNYALTSGDIGYHFLVRVLSENGRSDIIYKMNNRTDRPGYGYQLSKGATSLTESWAALADVSNNHMMLGHLMEWFYSGLGGIYQPDSSEAYKQIIIAPEPAGKINWVKCSYKSVKGIISSDWEIRGNIFSLKIEIPNESSARVKLPENFMNSSCTIVNLGNNEAVTAKNIRGSFELPAGKYLITSNKI